MEIILSEENKNQFYIPEGFAHGFLVLSEEAEFCYKCTGFYHPKDEIGIIWNDPYININWPIEDINELILSDKDKNWLPLKV
ncbi:dTDP-4-dehydrorhamnose 3,5-epimerase family protein [Clostridium aciditolerans]|uniref:dTDP-4-dehydrorhamnose 3,5-epimerase family protein n=1 Tax=Clostridium aciditolerans TaxID=339861 RepID=A0A934HYV4_9CLOT|nr:dTDP-4-dehydrorhamnose 3,5-epimerase family protein [Clostridium aciditolerans]